MRIDQGAADALIGCDLVVSSSPKASGTYRHGTRAVVNTAEMPTGDVVRFRDADLASRTRLRAIERVIGAGNMATVNANALAETLLGDTVFANVMMLGFAWQQGLVPVSLRGAARAPSSSTASRSSATGRPSPGAACSAPIRMSCMRLRATSRRSRRRSIR